jgi:hypothetical protein
MGAGHLPPSTTNKVTVSVIDLEQSLKEASWALRMIQSGGCITNRIIYFNFSVRLYQFQMGSDQAIGWRMIWNYSIQITLWSEPFNAFREWINLLFHLGTALGRHTWNVRLEDVNMGLENTDWKMRVKSWDAPLATRLWNRWVNGKHHRFITHLLWQILEIEGWPTPHFLIGQTNSRHTKARNYINSAFKNT